MPGARCTRSLVWEEVESHERRHREVHRDTRHSRTQWF
jgi:hypothetical protein